MKRKQGFAAMDKEKVSAIAAMGGKASQRKGTAHRWTSEEAQKAGRIGGVARSKKSQEQSNKKQTPIDNSES